MPYGLTSSSLIVNVIKYYYTFDRPWIYVKLNVKGKKNMLKS